MEAKRPPTAIARRIARQIESRLDGHSSSGDAFVVSIYGEWGIGKTRCLQDIHAQFNEPLQEQLKQLTAGEHRHWVVPVMFIPWQYEHEDHLVIPLLKTIEHTLKTLENKIKHSASASDRAKTASRAFRHAGGVIGDVAVSLLSGFQFKFSPLSALTGIDVEFSAKDALETARTASEARRKWSWSKIRSYFRSKARDELSRIGARRESLYFDIRSTLQSLTLDGEVKLRFVVLIDDLDRCLPEKSIQVLESVKLFLNVPGFSFVLAIDDEVVERGIAHRYRPYQTSAEGGEPASAPVSGAEYLEKIVHLPVHLPRWTEEEAAQFLRDRYPRLFQHDKIQSQSSRAAELLTLVIHSIPLVPRKLIRLAETLEYQFDHILDMNASEHWHPLHAARIVALQQLYPTLYRHIRLRPVRYWRLFKVEDNHYGEPAVRGGMALHALQAWFSNRPAKSEADEDSQARERSRSETDTRRELLDLLMIVKQSSQQRGNPNPLALFQVAADSAEHTPDGIGAGLSFDDFARLYLHGLALRIAPSDTLSASGQVAQVEDEDRLIAMLTIADTLTRREYLQSLQLRNALPDEVFEQLMQNLAELGDPEDTVADMEWLQDIAELTTPDQLLQLYQRLNILELLLDAVTLK